MTSFFSAFFQLAGALGIFLYGMKVMSDGIQKVAGSRLQKILNYMTRNRFVAVLTGFFITALVQSSSATTVMIVSFVNASLLNLTQAIGVIMGANIGTTVTTWIVSFIGFKFKITAIAVPIIGVGLPFIMSKRRKNKDWGEVLIGFGLLFLGLSFLKAAVPDIKHHPEILEFLRHWTNYGFFSYLFFVMVGTVLTVIVQSSSAAMAITVTMAYKGWIDFPTAAAIVLGENIGTTITAFLASIGANVNAKRAARAHMLFNILGVVWISIIFVPFTKLVTLIAPWDSSLQSNLPLNLSLFHTMFNIINTLVFLSFVPQFAKIVQKLVKEKKSDRDRVYKLQYIKSGVQNTPQLNLIKAKEEIVKMAEVTEEMFNTFQEVFNNPDKNMGSFVEKLRDQEDLTDQMQMEISKFLVECTNDDLGETSIKNVNALMRVVHELESVADSCFRLMLFTEKKYNEKIKLHPNSRNEVKRISKLVSEFISFYRTNLNKHLHREDLNLAYKLEEQIDNLRDTLKRESRHRIQDGANVKSELLYIDMIRHFEHIGDNSLNIAEALREIY